MSADYLQDHFRTPLERDVYKMLIGAPLGSGAFRDVFEHATNPKWVVKIENGEADFSNIREWDVWRTVRDTEFEKWFAPVEQISANGIVLIQHRCEPAQVSQLPERVPEFFTDLKAQNWGFYKGHPVCFDYGNHLLLKLGLTKKMKRAPWRNSPGGYRA